MASDRGAPVSYLVLAEGTPVLTRDGARVGRVRRVLAAPDEDIFDGLIITTPAGDRFVDGERAGELYERAVVLELDEADVHRLPDPSANPATMGADADDAASPDDLGRALRRAWDLISGRY